MEEKIEGKLSPAETLAQRAPQKGTTTTLTTYLMHITFASHNPVGPGMRAEQPGLETCSPLSSSLQGPAAPLTWVRRS